VQHRAVTRVSPAAALPAPRGELTARLFGHLQSPPHEIPGDLRASASAAVEDELHLALYVMYELHYRGFPDVDADWEWEPTLLGLRRVAEQRFEAELRAGAGESDVEPISVSDELWKLATAGGGPSLSKWVAEHASTEHVRELFKHRSAYQLKEADPHTWGIPRLAGEAKAVMTAIQADEYGNGQSPDMHCALFARTMEAVGLDSSPNAYLDEIPGFTLATTNLISMFGLHRRLRGCLVGHLALFEMTSTGPMGRYSSALERLGIAAPARRFFDTHVTADEIHQHLAADGMVGGLMRSDPDLAADVVLGARCLTLVEQRFSSEILGCWTSGRTSLRQTVRLSDQPAA
jgi:hypothetical protein